MIKASSDILTDLKVQKDFFKLPLSYLLFVRFLKIFIANNESPLLPHMFYPLHNYYYSKILTKNEERQ